MHWKCLALDTPPWLGSVCWSLAWLPWAAGFGIFGRGEGTFATVTSVRGETYEMATSGIYAFNSQRLVAEGVGWDIFTLLVAVPALLAALPALATGSFRGQLFVIGALAYFFYQYFMYALAWAFGPLFVLFIAIYAASLVGIVWIAADIGVAGIEQRFSHRFPRRAMAILSITMGVLLLLMWTQRIASGLAGDPSGGMLLGSTTMVVQALDLGLIVPLALFTGLMAWRGQAIGYLLSSIVVVQMVAMAAAISAMLLSASVATGVLEVVPLAIFGGTALAASALGVQMYRSVLPLTIEDEVGRFRLAMTRVR